MRRLALAARLGRVRLRAQVVGCLEFRPLPPSPSQASFCRPLSTAAASSSGPSAANGTPQQSQTPSEVARIVYGSDATCPGCGAKLQADDVSAPGFVDEAKLEAVAFALTRRGQVTKVSCRRCYRLQHYGRVDASQRTMAVEKQEGLARSVFTAIEASVEHGKLSGLRPLVLFVVDAFDLAGSKIAPVPDSLSGQNAHGFRLALVCNKRDLLPQGSDYGTVESHALRLLEASGMIGTGSRDRRAPDRTFFTSVGSTANSGLASVNEYLRSLDPPPPDVFVVGAPNVGKSTFVNRLRAVGMGRQQLEREHAPITTSPLPGTTLGSLPVRMSLAPPRSAFQASESAREARGGRGERKTPSYQEDEEETWDRDGWRSSFDKRGEGPSVVVHDLPGVVGDSDLQVLFESLAERVESEESKKGRKKAEREERKLSRRRKKGEEISEEEEKEVARLVLAASKKREEINAGSLLKNVLMRPQDVRNPATIRLQPGRSVYLGGLVCIDLVALKRKEPRLKAPVGGVGSSLVDGKRKRARKGSKKGKGRQGDEERVDPWAIASAAASSEGGEEGSEGGMTSTLTDDWEEWEEIDLRSEYATDESDKHGLLLTWYGRLKPHLTSTSRAKDLYNRQAGRLLAPAPEQATAAANANAAAAAAAAAAAGGGLEKEEKRDEMEGNAASDVLLHRASARLADQGFASLADEIPDDDNAAPRISEGGRRGAFWMKRLYARKERKRTAVLDVALGGLGFVSVTPVGTDHTRRRLRDIARFGIRIWAVDGVAVDLREPVFKAAGSGSKRTQWRI